MQGSTSATAMRVPRSDQSDSRPPPSKLISMFTILNHRGLVGDASPRRELSLDVSEEGVPGSFFSEIGSMVMVRNAKVEETILATRKLAVRSATSFALRVRDQTRELDL